MDTLPPRKTRVPEYRPNDGFWGLLNEADQTALRELGRLGTYKPGDVLCTEREQASHVFILINGWVKVASMTSDTRELVLGLRGSGDVIGELAAESNGLRTATVQAIAPVRALILPQAEFTRFLDDHPYAERAYRQVIVRRLAEIAEMLRGRAMSSGPQRLAAFLIDLGERHGTPVKGGMVIITPLSQEEIAGCIGVSRATVTRALADWRHRGIISNSRHRITILNVVPLRRIAHRDPGNRAQSGAT